MSTEPLLTPEALEREHIRRRNISMQKSADEAGIGLREYILRMRDTAERLVAWQRVLKATSFNAGEHAGETVPQYLARVNKRK